MRFDQLPRERQAQALPALDGLAVGCDLVAIQRSRGFRPAVVEGRQEKAFQAALAALGQTARPAGVVDGFDYSDGDKERLTLYRGAPIRPDEMGDEAGEDIPAEPRP